MPYADDLRGFDEPQRDAGGDIVARLAQALREERASQQPAGPLEGAMGSSRQYFPQLAAISGMQQAPPHATMGAFMDDPFERAAYRVAGRQVGPPERGTDADIAQGAMVMAPAPLRAIMSAPKLATAGLAAYNLLGGTDAAGGAEDTQSVKDLQIKLRDAGYYVGPGSPIDGNFGPATKRAKEAFDKAEQARADQERADKQLSVQEGSNAAALETARANKATADAKLEADRLQGEKDAATLARKQAGDERMRDIEKNISPMSRAIRDYSGPIGLSAGAVVGSGARYMTQKLSDFFTKETAKAGNAIMAAPTKTGAASNISRAARANAFWRAGGAKEVPFTQTPTKAPGFEVNPKASNLKDIYNPQISPMVEGAAAAPAVVEEEVSRHYRGQWEEELAKAQADAKEDPSEINIQRIQTAKDNVALFTGMQRAGMTSGAIQGVGAVGSRFSKKSPDMRPNMMAAENEQMSLQKILRDATERAQKKSSKNAPVVEVPRTGPQVGVPPAMTGPAAHKARTMHSF